MLFVAKESALKAAAAAAAGRRKRERRREEASRGRTPQQRAGAAAREEEEEEEEGAEQRGGAGGAWNSGRSGSGGERRAPGPRTRRWQREAGRSAARPGLPRTRHLRLPLGLGGGGCGTERPPGGGTASEGWSAVLGAARAAAAPSRREQVSRPGSGARSLLTPGPLCAWSDSTPDTVQPEVGDLPRAAAARSGGRFWILCSELVRRRKNRRHSRVRGCLREGGVWSAFCSRVGALVLLQEAVGLTHTRSRGKETHNLL